MGRYRKVKNCPSCGTKDVRRFGPNKSRHDGLQVYCRDCISQKKVSYKNAIIEGFIQRRLNEEQHVNNIPKL